MYINLKITPVKQSIGTFYSSVIDSSKLYSLAKADIIKISNNNDKLYEGIQREINKSKVNSIVNYLSQKDATFPNSIILNLNSDYEIRDDYLYFEANENSFSIIDGQHRLEGLHRSNINFDLEVSIYLGLSNTSQQEIFTRINSEQTKINPSVNVYKEAESRYKTPRNFASKIAINFGTDYQSPWFQKIKFVGKKDFYSQEGIISLKAFYDPILNYIYNDDDFYSIREDLTGNGNQTRTLISKHEHIFWNFYVEQDFSSVYKILNNYFSALKKILPNSWNDYNDNILLKTTGYNAIMYLFEYVYKLGIDRGTLRLEFFEAVLKPLTCFDGKLNSSEYPYSGNKSSRDLYNDFLNKLKDSLHDR